MGTVASQITKLTIVYSIVYSDTDQRKHQSSASLAFVRFTGDRWIPRTNGQLRGKCFHLMTSSCAFCLHHMLQCRPVVAFLSLATWVWSYHICNGNGVYLGHNTCLGAVLYSLNIHTDRIWNSRNLMWQGHGYCVNYGRIYYICLKITETQTGWWRVEQTALAATIPYMTESKMKNCRWIQYCINIQQWEALEKHKISVYIYNIFQPAYVFTRRQVSLDSIIRIWYTVRTSW